MTIVIIGIVSVVVVCLPRPMEGMGRLQFSDLFTELPVPPQAAGVVGTFLMYLFYISFWALSSLIFGPYRWHFFYRVSLFCVHVHFFSSTHGLNAV